MSNEQIALYGTDLFGHPIERLRNGELSRAFLVPPFSVLNTREGYWQERKRAWISLGIKSELGRGQDLTYGDTPQITEPGLNYYRNRKKPRPNAYDSQESLSAIMRQKGRQDASPGGSPMPACDYSRQERGDGRGRPMGGVSPQGGGQRRAATGAYRSFREPNSVPGGAPMPLDRLAGSSGVSIFDPVLTELAYRWFCPPSGQVVDAFAGGSVRAIVAHLLGYRYWGSELREEQVAANYEQVDILGDLPVPSWLCGDALELLPLAPEADFLFTCPPYGDLERYSDDPRDLSTMEYHAFLAAYKRVIMRACQRLKPHRFAAIVVGDFRDRRGFYRGFVGDTIAAFREQGLELYNELIVLTAIGSLPVRTGKQFRASRKVGRAHQTMLVFIKGNPRTATALCEGQGVLL